MKLERRCLGKKKGDEERQKEILRMSRSFVTEHARLHLENNGILPPKRGIVRDSIASSPGCGFSANLGCTLAAEAPGSSGCETFRCNSVSEFAGIGLHWFALACD